MPEHLPLPRAVGPYHTVRVTRVFTSTQRLHLFGQWLNTSQPAIESIVSIASVDANLAMNASGNCQYYSVSSNVYGMHVAPAALTVRVTNSNPLSTTSGTVQIGQFHGTQEMRDISTTWTDYAGWLVSYANPTSVSAAQLAANAAEVSCVPAEIEEMCEFKTAVSSGGHTNPQPFTMTKAGFGNTPYALAPVWVYNASGVNLTYEVQLEYRVRPGHSSPFQSSATLHRPSSHSAWFDAIKAVLEHGVEIVGAAGPVIAAISALL